MDAGQKIASGLIDRSELGRRLRVLRAWNNWTLREVGSRLGISESTLSRWEHGQGERYPDLDRLSKLAQLYEVGLPSLLDPSADSATRVWFNGRT